MSATHPGTMNDRSAPSLRCILRSVAEPEQHAIQKLPTVSPSSSSLCMFRPVRYGSGTKHNIHITVGGPR
eukprot:8160401-Pyramimonas_sp.AAC.1